MAESGPRKRIHARRYCSHCNCSVSKSTWYLHQNQRSVAKKPKRLEDDFCFSGSDSSASEFSPADEDLEINWTERENSPSEHEDSQSEESDASSGPELWNDSDLDDDNPSVVNDGNIDASTKAKVIVLFLLTWQSLFRIANVAMTSLFRFISLLLCYLATLTQSNYLKQIAGLIPDSTVKAQKFLKLNRDDFKQYVCCPKCCSLYEFSECFEQVGGQRAPKNCSACKFPRHPMASYRGCCGSKLLKTVQTSRKVVYRPIKTYCYKPVASSLVEILSRPGMVETCEHWRTRCVVPSLFADVYDGGIWKKFESDDFFSQSHSFGLLLNVDWFEPFDHSIYAVGVVFMALLNLPRHMRYLQENIIVCGLIPGAKEPQYNINPFLEPLVEDLLQLWRGKDLTLPFGTIKVRAALLCVSCDSPAMRKVAGFLSHTATKGCFKCLKSFPTANFGEKPDYSGFDRENWENRTHSRCHELGLKHKHAKTAKERHELERAHGIRYTVLVTLPYYDCVRFCMVDPMHNLLLGSAKTFVKVWKQQGSEVYDFECLQEAVDKFIIPAGVGRIPRKVEGGFKNFKAEQWKNWILIYSLVCFKPVLSSNTYSLWVMFVQACALLCSYMISQESLQLADNLIHQYCCLFEQEFGKDECYPNLHLHCHLKQCLLDYGPATSFWLFAFERMNGCLGSFHTNNQAVELQLFRKFISKQQITTADWPDLEVANQVRPLLTDSSSPKDFTHSGGLYIHVLQHSSEQAISAANSCCRLLPPIKRKAFHFDHLAIVDSYFTLVFKERYQRTLILHKQSKSMFFNGEFYGSFFSRQQNSALVIAHTVDTSGTTKLGPCFILGFMQCTVFFVSPDYSTDYVIAKVFPLEEHPQKNFYPYPAEVWQKPDSNELQDSLKCTYILCSHLVCRCAYSPFDTGLSRAGITVIPCNPYFGAMTPPSSVSS